ncbi:hypothetical protein SASPL_128998 [Salvia splendens]|uniref:Serine/threonine-protein phosphatase 2A regulatory subunit B n=1 Tax=Salvia splendens TaxID=180675 RepID=A0A8X8XAJ9_SALSN|nr:hypothetical protein SASPL_128998 [Salvia splendens]
MGANPNSPKFSSLKKMKSNTLKSLLQHDSIHSGIRLLHRSSEHDKILSLISCCAYTYTFSDPSPSESPSLHSFIKLLAVLKPMAKGKGQQQGRGPCLPDEILSPLFTMTQDHLFRPLPPPNTSITCPPLPNDPRERERLKNVYHRIYSKLHGSRSFMRKAMNDVFLHCTFEGDERHAGIGDLLEICGTIINGFSVPLKEEHRIFLMRVLMPLHRPKGMQAYHKQLAYSVYQFVQKEPLLGVAIILEYKAVALPLCNRITKCFNSPNSQVAERALYMWNNERFVKMALQAAEEVLPVVVGGMEEMRGQWSKSVRQLTQNVKEMLVEMEPLLYSSCLTQFHHSRSEAETRRQERWERVETAFKVNQFIQEYLTSRLRHC